MTLPSKLKMYSTILHSWSAQDLRSSLPRLAPSQFCPHLVSGEGQVWWDGGGLLPETGVSGGCSSGIWAGGEDDLSNLSKKTFIYPL